MNIKILFFHLTIKKLLKNVLREFSISLLPCIIFCVVSFSFKRSVFGLHVLREFCTQFRIFRSLY